MGALFGRITDFAMSDERIGAIYPVPRSASITQYPSSCMSRMTCFARRSGLSLDVRLGRARLRDSRAAVCLMWSAADISRWGIAFSRGGGAGLRERGALGDRR